MRETAYLPRARTDGLVVKELTDEVLVYDLKRDKAHCLNLAAAAVWKLCDGRSTAAEIASRVAGGVRREARGSRQEQTARASSHTNTEPGAVATGLYAEDQQRARHINEQVVWLALEQLSRDRLLTERVIWPAAVPHMSRREALRRVGIGAAIALPIVVSITAPTPAQAGTCKAKGASCGTGSQCCSKACVGGICA
jgi:hypothetical protein